MGRITRKLSNRWMLTWRPDRLKKIMLIAECAHHASSSPFLLGGPKPLRPKPPPLTKKGGGEVVFASEYVSTASTTATTATSTFSVSKSRGRLVPGTLFEAQPDYSSASFPSRGFSNSRLINRHTCEWVERCCAMGHVGNARCASRIHAVPHLNLN